MTDLLGDRAVRMIEQLVADRRPFLLSLHFSAPHWPWEGPDGIAESQRLAGAKSISEFADFDGGSLETFAAMVRRMDGQVARVLATLDRLGASRDTIVIFTSDNGGERFADTWPLTGRKTELLEGGIRVPTLLRWPALVKPGAKSDAQIITMDWLPTLLAAAGISADPAYPPDGIDIGSVLRGGVLPERTLYWRYKHMSQRACRRGD